MTNKSASKLVKQMKFVIVEHMMNNPELREMSKKDIKQTLFENELIKQHYITPLFGRIGVDETKRQFSFVVESAINDIDAGMEESSPRNVPVVAAGDPEYGKGAERAKLTKFIQRMKQRGEIDGQPLDSFTDWDKKEKALEILRDFGYDVRRKDLFDIAMELFDDSDVMVIDDEDCESMFDAPPSYGF